MNLNSFLKKSAKLYLNDDPALVKKIENKDLTHWDLEEIIRIYNDFKNEK